LRLKILKKLRIASLNSEFTGSYKKSVLYHCVSSDVCSFSQHYFSLVFTGTVAFDFTPSFIYSAFF